MGFVRVNTTSFETKIKLKDVFDWKVIKIKVHHYFKRHRIQDGKAIVSLVLRNEIPLFQEGYQFLEWIGDAYELRDELNKQIELLENKYEKM